MNLSVLSFMVGLVLIFVSGLPLIWGAGDRSQLNWLAVSARRKPDDHNRFVHAYSEINAANRRTHLGGILALVMLLLGFGLLLAPLLAG